MMKYFIGWIGCSAASGFLLYTIVRLMLIGFSALLSTVVVCTKYQSDKMNTEK